MNSFEFFFHKLLYTTYQEFAHFVQNWWMTEGAFSMVYATKPQSIAYAFNDSPVGLASRIISMISSLSTG